MNDYLFLMRGTKWDQGLSPAETQGALEKMIAWIDGLHQNGHLKGGQPLSSDGKVVTASLMDGPFVESKEAVGGYLLVQAATIEDATKLAQACPVLEHGLFIEVRPVVNFCSMMEDFEMQFPHLAK